MGKLRRNLENTHGFAQAIHKEILELKERITALETLIQGISAQVHKANFKTLMADDVDLSEFFPVERKEQIEQFMDREHPEWNARKQEFYHFLYTLASKIKKGFARSMIKALFSRQYIKTVKWPSAG